MSSSSSRVLPSSNPTYPLKNVAQVLEHLPHKSDLSYQLCAVCGESLNRVSSTYPPRFQQEFEQVANYFGFSRKDEKEENEFRIEFEKYVLSVKQSFIFSHVGVTHKSCMDFLQAERLKQLDECVTTADNNFQFSSSLRPLNQFAEEVKSKDYFAEAIKQQLIYQFQYSHLDQDVPTRTKDFYYYHPIPQIEVLWKQGESQTPVEKACSLVFDKLSKHGVTPKIHVLHRGLQEIALKYRVDYAKFMQQQKNQKAVLPYVLEQRTINHPHLLMTVGILKLKLHFLQTNSPETETKIYNLIHQKTKDAVRLVLQVTPKMQQSKWKYFVIIPQTLVQDNIRLIDISQLVKSATVYVVVYIQYSTIETLLENIPDLDLSKLLPAHRTPHLSRADPMLYTEPFMKRVMEKIFAVVEEKKLAHYVDPVYLRSYGSSSSSSSSILPSPSPSPSPSPPSSHPLNRSASMESMASSSSSSSSTYPLRQSLSLSSFLKPSSSMSSLSVKSLHEQLESKLDEKDPLSDFIVNFGVESDSFQSATACGVFKKSTDIEVNINVLNKPCCFMFDNFYNEVFLLKQNIENTQGFPFFASSQTWSNIKSRTLRESVIKLPMTEYSFGWI